MNTEQAKAYEWAIRCACWNDDELCGGKLCEYCAKFNKFDAKKPWPCDKPCKDACEWQWRGDAEEGEKA